MQTANELIRTANKSGYTIVTIETHPECEAREHESHYGHIASVICVNGIDTSILVTKGERGAESGVVEVSWASHSDKSIEMCELFATAMPFALELAKSYKK